MSTTEIEAISFMMWALAEAPYQDYEPKLAAGCDALQTHISNKGLARSLDLGDFEADSAYCFLATYIAFTRKYPSPRHKELDVSVGPRNMLRSIAARTPTPGDSDGIFAPGQNGEKPRLLAADNWHVATFWDSEDYKKKYGPLLGEKNFRIYKSQRLIGVLTHELSHVRHYDFMRIPGAQAELEELLCSEMNVDDPYPEQNQVAADWIGPRLGSHAATYQRETIAQLLTLNEIGAEAYSLITSRYDRPTNQQETDEKLDANLLQEAVALAQKVGDLFDRYLSKEISEIPYDDWQARSCGSALVKTSTVIGAVSMIDIDKPPAVTYARMSNGDLVRALHDESRIHDGMLWWNVNQPLPGLIDRDDHRAIAFVGMPIIFGERDHDEPTQRGLAVEIATVDHQARMPYSVALLLQTSDIVSQFEERYVVATANEQGGKLVTNGDQWGIIMDFDSVATFSWKQSPYPTEYVFTTDQDQVHIDANNLLFRFAPGKSVPTEIVQLAPDWARRVTSIGSRCFLTADSDEKIGIENITSMLVAPHLPITEKFVSEHCQQVTAQVLLNVGRAFKGPAFSHSSQRSLG